MEECGEILAPLDRHGLLTDGGQGRIAGASPMDDDELFVELGVNAAARDVTKLRHVRSGAEKRMAEEVASRFECRDFERFRPRFAQVRRDLDEGVRHTRPFKRKADIETGRFFVVGGQTAYVASVGKVFTQQYGTKDARLRVIFDNGTESNLLRRSLQRALHKDPAGRRITEPTLGPLFGGWAAEGDRSSGSLYVLRSKSDDPWIAENRDLIHKIGVTGGDVQRRVSGARAQSTFLNEGVEVVEVYGLYNVDRAKLERLVHRFFAAARLDVEVKDGSGDLERPQEWFLVPLPVIDEALRRIRDGTITNYAYDRGTASLVPR